VNIRQAEKTLGITYSTRTEAGRLKALAEAKRQIVAARRAGDDERAKELSAAKALFTRQRKNRCEVCGVTINAKATRCAQHQRNRAPKAIPFSDDFPKPASDKPGNQRRTDVAPEGGEIARLGYYAKPVQKIVKRWLAQGVREEWIEDVFVAVATPIRFRNHKTEIHVAHPGLWPMAWELGQAIHAVLSDKTSADYWLLTMRTGTMQNGMSVSDREIAEAATAATGKLFNEATIRKGSQRLRLNTPESIAKDYRKARPF